MASITKVEIGGLFHNGEPAYTIRLTNWNGASVTSHPYASKELHCFRLHNMIHKWKLSKAIYMRFHWIKDRESQNETLIYWKLGLANLGDYFTSTILLLIILYCNQNISIRLSTYPFKTLTGTIFKSPLIKLFRSKINLV